MQISDSLTLDASGLTFTRDGFLVGDAKIARAGNVQQYYGYEIGLTGDKARQAFGVYRDPDMVFDRDAMLSLAGRPVTRGHPPEGVDASNWRDLAVGQVGGVIRKDGEHVVASMAIMDAAAARDVSNGARSLSAGYTCDVIPDEGTAPDGTPYQFRQAGPLRFNHVAFLPDNNPRAGNTRMGDSEHRARTPKPKGTDEMTKTVTVDGKQIEVAADVASVIEALQAKIADSDTKYSTLVDTSKQLADIVDAHTAVKAAEVAAKDAKIADLEKKIPTADELQQMADERAAIITDAKLIASDLDAKGKDAAAIKSEAVKAKLGDAAVEGKSADYIAAAFDMLVADAKADDADPIRSALKSGATDNKVSPRDKYLADTANAWKGA